MRKVINPFRGLEGYNCFGCSPDNKFGLQLSFVDEGEYLTASWTPKEYFQGYNNMLHGGIQSTLIDEIASWYVYAKLKTAGVTSRLEVRYKKPVYTNKGDIKLRAKLLGMQRNLANFEVELFDNDGVLCAFGNVQYFTFNEKVSREKFWYPGGEAFFEE